MVQGCTRTKQPFWTEDQFVVTASSEIRDRDKRVTGIVARDLEKAKPGKWGCVQARELWSPKEEAQMRPGHHWLLMPGGYDCQLFRASRRRLRSQRSDTATTRGSGAGRPAYARRGSEADSRHGYQEVCTLRGP